MRWRKHISDALSVRRECNGDLKLGALDPGVSGAVGIGAVVESAEQLDRPLKGMETPVSVVTDVHHPSAAQALAFDDVELPQGEGGILGPSVGHRADLPAARAALGFIAWVDQARGY